MLRTPNVVGRRAPVAGVYACLVEVQRTLTWRLASPSSFLVIVLSALKLTGVIGWSWWLVLLPLCAGGGRGWRGTDEGRDAPGA
jgi:hypothetical protein